MRSDSFRYLCVGACALLLSGVAPLTVAAPPENSAKGFLDVNGGRVSLVHAYVDLTDADEPIVVLSDKDLPASAIPFLPEKLVKAQKIHAIAFSISLKDKKLTNTYGKVHYPGHELGVGFGRVEDGKVTLAITKLDAASIEGRITTPQPVKFSDVSYSFDLSFKVSLGKKK